MIRMTRTTAQKIAIWGMLYAFLLLAFVFYVITHYSVGIMSFSAIFGMVIFFVGFSTIAYNLNDSETQCVNCKAIIYSNEIICPECKTPQQDALNTWNKFRDCLYGFVFFVFITLFNDSHKKSPTS